MPIITNEENVTPVTEIQPLPPLDNTAVHGTSASPANMSRIELFKRCFICKKYIKEMVDTFIYMDMLFCSNECRSKEMDKDNHEEKPKNTIPVKLNRNKKSRRKNYTPIRSILHSHGERN